MQNWTRIQWELGSGLWWPTSAAIRRYNPPTLVGELLAIQQGIPKGNGTFTC